MNAFTFPNLSARAKAAAITKYWRDALYDAQSLNVDYNFQKSLNMDTFAWFALCGNGWLYNTHGERLAF